MGNLFFGLNVGRSAMLANQAALDVTGHNLSNVQTEGYSRQRASMVQSLPIEFAEQTFGSGVSVDAIERLQIGWVERQINRVQMQNSYAEALRSGVEQLETLLGEPSSDGLGAALNEFWNSWDALSARPTDAALRSQVLQQSQYLATVYNQKIATLVEAERRFNETLADDISEVNALTAQLADMNARIANAEASGRRANDLMDQRDQLVRRVTEKLGVDVEADGAFVNLRLPDGGTYLLNRTEAFGITAGTVTGGILGDFRIGQGPAHLTGGQIGAAVELRDTISPGLRADLGTLMGTAVDQINRLHGAGYDRDGLPGRNLFVWEGGATLTTSYLGTGVSQILPAGDLQPGTHHLEVGLTDNPLASPLPEDGGIVLTETGSFSGSLDAPHYHVRVVAGGGPGAFELQLYKGDGAVGSPIQPIPDPADPTGTARYTWSGVDGMSFTAEVDLSGGAPVAGTRSNVRSVALSLDGGPAAVVDTALTNSVVLTAGSSRGFSPPPGTTATVTFSGQTFAGTSFTLSDGGGRLGLDSQVAADIDKVVASLVPDAAGDGEMARRIADLANSAMFEGTNETPSRYLGRAVQALGARGRDAEIMQEAGESILLQLTAQKQAEVGVNVDEEMVYLIQYQRGFQAAARFLNTVDIMLETLINGTGR